MATTVRLAAATVLAGVCAVMGSPSAGADPTLPDPPPYLPGNVDPVPGSFSYPYNVIMVGPPWTVDARGIQVGTNASAGQPPVGLPGSQLGTSPHPANSLTSANARYGISAGMEPAPAVDPGVIVGAGVPAPSGLEDPKGQPPSTAPVPEAAAPTTAPPAQPALEDPHGGSGSGDSH
jgi:hypothetical protein